MALLSIGVGQISPRLINELFLILVLIAVFCSYPVMVSAQQSNVSSNLITPMDETTLPLPSPSSFSGITEAITDVTLSLPIDGRVAALFVQEGEKVEKDQLLLSFDSKAEELEVERRKLLWKSKVELESAIHKEKTLKSFLDRTRQLRERTGSISKEEFEEQVLEYFLAVGARKHLEITEQREELEYYLAAENLARRSLRAPADGFVIEIFRKEGEGAESNDPLVKLVDTSKCLFIANVDEQVGRTLKTGQMVDLQIKAGNSTVAKKGEIIFTSPVVDPASGLQKVNILFDNQDGKIRPGVSGTFSIKPQ